MNHSELQQAGRASAADLATLAAQGVQRAQAARLTTLSAQQVQAVSGGLALAFDDYCGTGVRPIPKLSGNGLVGGGVVILINGQYPKFSVPAATLGL